jgi:hypothetical protein
MCLMNEILGKWMGSIMRGLYFNCYYYYYCYLYLYYCYFGSPDYVYHYPLPSYL